MTKKNNKLNAKDHVINHISPIYFVHVYNDSHVTAFIKGKELFINNYTMVFYLVTLVSLIFMFLICPARYSIAYIAYINIALQYITFFMPVCRSPRWSQAQLSASCCYVHF